MNKVAKFGVQYDSLSEDEIRNIMFAEPVKPAEIGVVKVGWTLSWAIGLGKCEDSNPIGLWPMLARTEFDKTLPKWNMEAYWSPWFAVNFNTNVELRQFNKKWIVVGDGLVTSVYPDKVPAILSACKLIGVPTPPTNHAITFAAKEQEAGWPRGWWFDEFLP